MDPLLVLATVLYMLGGICQLPREWEIYVSEDHPSTSPNPDTVGAIILIGRFVRWPFRLTAQPRIREYR